MHANNGNSSHTAQSKQQTFILRCWTNIEGQTRLRLIDVQSGKGYYLEKIDQLNNLVSSLVKCEHNEETTP